MLRRRRRRYVDSDVIRACCASTGNAIVNVVPLPAPWLWAVMWPPCNSTMRLTIDKPSPVELSPAVGLADRRWKRPNRRDMSSGERPGPLSDTWISTSSPSWRAEISIRPPIGEYLMALLTRLSIASRRRSGSPLTRRSSGASIATTCAFFSISGRLVSTTSRTSSGTSIASGRILMLSASAMASASSVSTMPIRRSAESRMCLTWERTLSAAIGVTSRKSVIISVRPVITPSGFLRSCATLPRISLLKALARRSLSHWAERRAVGGGELAGAFGHPTAPGAHSPAAAARTG